MRKIKKGPIVSFVFFFLLAMSFAIVTVQLAFSIIDFGCFQGIGIFGASLMLFFLCSLAVRNIFLRLLPLKEGHIIEESRDEFIYSVYILYHLMFFDPIIRSGILPQPMLRKLYIMLGARIGSNTYGSGIIYDPMFVQVGENSLLGHDSLLIPHVIENSILAHYPIHIGNNVTIGAHSIIMSGVTIGDDALVAAGAVVNKGTHIGSGEIWGGVPARFLRKRSSAEIQKEQVVGSNLPVESDLKIDLGSGLSMD